MGYPTSRAGAQSQAGAQSKAGLQTKQPIGESDPNAHVHKHTKADPRRVEFTRKPKKD